MSETITKNSSEKVDERERIIRETMGKFVKENELMCCIMMELCESVGADYSKVMIGGVNRYYEWKRSMVENISKESVDERVILESDIVNSEIIKYSDDEKIDMWVRDYNCYKERGETNKLECLTTLISKNESIGLVKRFYRIIGKDYANIG